MSSYVPLNLLITATKEAMQCKGEAATRDSSGSDYGRQSLSLRFSLRVIQRQISRQ